MQYMNFLIQTIEGEIKHDFSFTLLEAIRYQNWINNDQGCTYLLINEKMPAFRKDGIPVGSVEFVSHYLETHFNKKPMPRNIPDPLIPFADRLVFNDTEKGLIDKYFVKSNEKIKSEKRFSIEMVPAEKLIEKARKRFPKLKIAGFKAETNKSMKELEKIAKEFLRKNKLQLVVANDVARNEMGSDINEVLIVSEKNNAVVKGEKEKIAKEICNQIEKII